ncbi:MAG TPA: hypothetical protein VGV39_00265 [Mesorhizobium sp.]|jgi:hypothetical protein|uniref:hypothetical protein n=1 Tax=Mesorhizobium sp. TaxID=1871066 RepID=UPI002DDCF8F3|nr:hypothetical protein [Mesorhizobium sp.]HEV2501474.1 hypothetical protein [Mesorhizobium sp.]
MTAALFRRLANVSRSVVETVYGDECTVRPVDKVGGPNGKSGWSTQRPSYEVKACFYENSDAQRVDDPRPMLRPGVQITTNRASAIQASIRLYDPSRLRTDDILHRHSDAAFFEVTAIDPDGLGGAMLTLAVAKQIGPI